jgi:hypothetical protein
MQRLTSSQSCKICILSHHSRALIQSKALIVLIGHLKDCYSFQSQQPKQSSHYTRHLEFRLDPLVYQEALWTYSIPLVTILNINRTADPCRSMGFLGEEDTRPVGRAESQVFRITFDGRRQPPYRKGTYPPAPYQSRISLSADSEPETKKRD